MSDIPNIERLREAQEVLRPLTVKDLGDNWTLFDAIATGEEAVALLLDLADEGAELWVERECRHGQIAPHPVGVPGCTEGSRVRVWPKEAE